MEVVSPNASSKAEKKPQSYFNMVTTFKSTDKKLFLDSN